jgi:hypothetical protein
MEVTGLVASIAACLSSAFLDGTCTPHAALQHYNTSLLLPSYSPLTYLSPTLDKPQCQVHASSPALLYIQRGLQGDACVILIPYEAVPGAWVASIDTSSNLKGEREREKEEEQPTLHPKEPTKKALPPTYTSIHVQSFNKPPMPLRGKFPSPQHPAGSELPNPLPAYPRRWLYQLIHHRRDASQPWEVGGKKSLHTTLCIFPCIRPSHALLTSLQGKGRAVLGTR